MFVVVLLAYGLVDALDEPGNSSDVTEISESGDPWPDPTNTTEEFPTLTSDIEPSAFNTSEELETSFDSESWNETETAFANETTFETDISFETETDTSEPETTEPSEMPSETVSPTATESDFDRFWKTPGGLAVLVVCGVVFGLFALVTPIIICCRRSALRRSKSEESWHDPLRYSIDSELLDS